MPGQLLAFHSDAEIKAKYVDRVRRHRELDQIIKGQYWQGGKGCAVGCTIHGLEHDRYEKELGIPTALAMLEDAIFEGLPDGEAKDFPLAFLAAIPVGADLSMVAPKSTHWLLTSPEIDLASKADDAGKSCIVTVANLYRRWIDGDKPPESEWDAASAAARAAASAARAAAWAPANFSSRRAAGTALAAAGVAGAAARDAAGAALAATWDAASAAAGAAAGVARAAAWDAAAGVASAAAWAPAAGAAGAAAWDAEDAVWGKMAKKLLQLMSEAPVVLNA